MGEKKSDFLYINLVVPGLPLNGNSLDEKSLGGSESAAVYMAKALARAGHKVTVFCNLDGPQMFDKERARYLPIQLWHEVARTVETDVTVVQRAPEMFAQPVNSRLNLLWCHDMPHRQAADAVKGTMWNIDRVITLSGRMTDEYRRVYKLDESEVFQSRNGVDVGLIRRLAKNVKKRNMRKLMYCARPERGLDNLLLNVMPRLLDHDPSLRLHVAWYDNPVDHLAQFYVELERVAHRLGDRVVMLGSLNKRQLYQHYLTAGLYLYPTPSKLQEKFWETSCITAMECMAAGLPMVASDRGALPETYPFPEQLVAGDAWTDEYADAFAAVAIRLLDDRDEWGAASHQGVELACDLGWDAVAEDWAARFRADITAHNSDQARFARHCLRTSDIMMLEKMVTEETWEDAATENEMAQELMDHYSFAATDESHKEHYERVGENHDKRYRETVVHESRYAALRDWLKTRAANEVIMDYGAAHCSYDVNLCKELGHEWVCVEIDSNGLRMGHEFAEDVGVADKMRFVNAASPKDLSPIEYQPSVILVQEVLEHVREPWRLLDELEAVAAPGATVYITVPFGPWEYSSYRTNPLRGHLWHFDQHDLMDMLGDKADLDMNALPHSNSPELGDPMGWWVVSYTVGKAKTGVIDMARKRWLARPKQTVSVNMMCGAEAEQQLDWVLHSVRDLADEVVIADCGMCDEALAIAERHGALVHAAPDPMEEGFEAPRNVALDRSRMDWVLWIDDDEKFISAASARKYLRENAFHGYSIRQHHFAVDTQFPPDMPVRLFRRRPHVNADGEAGSMRFYGMIHEHPELGLNKGPGPTVVLTDLHIAHTGYLVEQTRQGRFVRNYPMLEKDKAKYPDRLIQKHFVMRDNTLLARYEMMRNGGRRTEHVDKLLEEVVELGRTYFVGKAGYMRKDSLVYYSEALMLLGKGIDVAYQLAADAQQARPNGITQLRFADKDDFMAELTQLAAEAIDPLTLE